MSYTNIDRTIDRTKAEPLPRSWGHWLVGILLATALFALLHQITEFSYYGSDDVPILRSFMGYEGGVPASYHLYLHTAFAWMLHGLALWFPGVAWFSILQLVMLWFSCVVIIKGMSQCAAGHGISPLVGILFALMFLLVYAVFILCRVSYTTTAALLGTAAVAQLMGIPYAKGSNRQVYGGILLSTLLLIFCYCFRQISVLPPAAFALLALAIMWLQHFGPLPKAERSKEAQEAFLPGEAPAQKPKGRRLKRSSRPILLGLLTAALLFGALAGVREYEIKALDLGEYMEWQQARINLFDYTGFVYDTDPEAIPSFGWTYNQFYLVGQWFFMAGNITTQALRQVYALQPTHDTLPKKLAQAQHILAEFFQTYPAYAYGGLLLLLIALLGLVMNLRRRRGWMALAPVVALVLGLGLLVYLGILGRLPLRAAVSVLFPLGTMLFSLLLQSLQRKYIHSRRQREGGVVAMGLAAVLLCLLLGASVCVINLRDLRYNPEEETLARIEGIPVSLDEYGLENPDILIIYDITCLLDNRMFPDVSQGIPTNVMFWGGYPARSPSWLYQLAQFGIDGNTMTAADFLREDVVVASAVGKPYPALHQYLIESLDTDVDWDFYGEDGYISFFQFDEY